MFRTLTATSLFALAAFAGPALAQLPYDERNHLDFDSGFPVGPYDAAALALEGDHGAAAAGGCVALDVGRADAPCHS
ncbi:MAG: hypothetical protein WBA25_05390, partial [Jannaschia sp.]